MKKFAMLFAAVMMAVAAMLFGGQPASAAPAADIAAKTEAATNSNVQDVYWHRSWRSHHRWGSRRHHSRWDSRRHHRGRW